MPPETDPATPQEPRSVWRSPVAATLLVGLFAVAGGLVLNAGVTGSDSAIHAQLEFFSVFAALSVFLLAGAKYAVGGERPYRFLALGGLAAAIMDLVHPAVDSSLVASWVSPGAGLWIASIGRLLFALGLGLACRAASSTVLDVGPGRRLIHRSILVVTGCTFLVALAVTLPLPNFYALSLGTGPVVELLPSIVLAGAGYCLLVLPRGRSGGLRTVGLSAVVVATMGQLFAHFSRAPYDPAFFAAHVTKILASLVLLFGLYLEHVRLYGYERSLRESVEVAHSDVATAKLELDAIIEHLPIGVAITDPAGRIVRFNRAAERILGRPHMPIGPERWAGEFHAEALDGTPFPVDRFPIVRALTHQRAASEAEMMIIRPDKVKRRISVGAAPLLDASGRIRGAVAAFHDVTEMRSAEQRLRDLTEGAPDAVIVVDEEWKISVFNRAAEQLFGYSHLEAIGRRLDEFIPVRLEEALEQTKENVDGAATDQERRTLTARGRRKDGAEVPIEVTLSESTSDIGRIYIAHVRDVRRRERLRREREGITSVALSAISTHTSEEFLERAASSIVVTTEFDACTIYLPDADKRNLVLAASEGLPQEVVERVRTYPLTVNFPAIAVQTWFAQSVIYERHLQERTGLQVSSELMSKYRYQTLISARLGTQEEPWGVLQVVATEGRHPREEDLQLITLLAQELTNGLAQKRLVRQLELSTEELRAANKELDSFIYTASHDLAEPLRSISNFSHFLIEDYAKGMDDQGKDYLSRVHAGALRMKRLLDDLLRLSRHGRSRAPRVRVDPDEVIQEVRESLDAALRDRHARLEVQSSLPSVVADRTGLLEVFTNLVGNGLKFNESPSPVVTVSGARMDGFVEFAVQDNGIGIGRENHDKIFGLFTRLHTRKAYPGTGAGLAIVKKIVENHGGRIWLESNPGDGSTFRFTFPAAVGRTAAVKMPATPTVR